MKLFLGDYPPEYIPKIHGPYDPARYYGKPDTPLGQVKLSELGAWIGRRSFHPRSMLQTWTRGYWKWQHKYVHPKRVNFTAVFHIMIGWQILYYALNYQKCTVIERRAKYH